MGARAGVHRTPLRRRGCPLPCAREGREMRTDAPREDLRPMPTRRTPRPAPRERAAGGDAAPAARRHDPRALAALCYSVPVVPSCMLLLRERRSRFLRFHAAQALVCFALVVAVQAVLYVLLVVAGGLIANDAVAAAAG